MKRFGDGINSNAWCDKHNKSDISTSISTRKENMFFFLVLMLVLMSFMLCLSHKCEPGLIVGSTIKDDFQSVLRSLCTLMFVSLSNKCKSILFVMNEPLTLSLRRILNSFSNSFHQFYSYEGFSSSDIRKSEA